jgi:hypothetical protein
MRGNPTNTNPLNAASMLLIILILWVFVGANEL